MSTKTWSAQQEAIFGWFDGSWFPAVNQFDTSIGARLAANLVPRHLVVRARAGTGKTTTILEGINRAPEKNIILCAFNKRIAEELQTRITNPRAKAQTLHSLGFGLVRNFWRGVRVGNGSDRADALAAKVCGARAADAVIRLVSKLHTKAREINPHARNFGELTDLLYQFECEPDEMYIKMGFDAAYVERKALEAMELAATVKPVDTGIDFADMIFLPVRNGWMHKQYDLVVVDEAQDMTIAQLEIAQGVASGRIAVVGDDRQAIYGFRGADSGSLDRLKNELRAVELPLTCTYRCGLNIVAEANRLVSDFTGAAKHEGTISDASQTDMLNGIRQGDFLLSRTNAPLVSAAFALLRAGKRARIAGRDIGAGLKSLVRKLGKNCKDVECLIDRINIWRERETRKFAIAKREAQVDRINDQAETLLVICEEANSIADVEARIDGLFTDDGLGQAGVITCSSVHRSKGLEADTVYLLDYTLYPRGVTMEEQNIEYVAITRAKNTFVRVSKDEIVNEQGVKTA
jgi:superfamily I DNA/RNA helicase